MNKLLEISTHLTMFDFNSRFSKSELFFEEITMENMKYIVEITQKCKCPERTVSTNPNCALCGFSYRYLNNALWIFDYDNPGGIPA